MKQVFALIVALVFVAGVVLGFGGCSKEEYLTNPAPSPSPEPPRTLVYTDALQQGGPGYVDVYRPVADVTSSTAIPVSAGYAPAFSIRGSRPSIIALHGGDWRTGGRYQVGPIASEFASNGYVVFAPDYSLAPQVEWPAPLVDLQTLVRYMRTNADSLGIDPLRIGVWGTDAGGQLGSMLALRNDPVVTSSSTGSTSSSTTLEEVVVTTGRVRGVVTVMAAQDLTIPGGLGPNEDSILQDLLGAPRIQLSPSRLLDASPVSFARPDSSTLIIHGTNDQVVAIDNSEHLFQALTTAKADVGYVRVSGGGHDATTYHAPEAWASTLQFFQTRLSGGPTPLSTASSSSGK